MTYTQPTKYIKICLTAVTIDAGHDTCPGGKNKQRPLRRKNTNNNNNRKIKIQRRKKEKKKGDILHNP